MVNVMTDELTADEIRARIEHQKEVVASAEEEAKWAESYAHQERNELWRLEQELQKAEDKERTVSPMESMKDWAEQKGLIVE